MELDCVLPLKALLKTSTPMWTESAITLLSTLSAHPQNNVRPLTHCTHNIDKHLWKWFVFTARTVCLNHNNNNNWILGHPGE